ELSSYQIAYKYNTTRATIGKLGKAHLGDNIFRKKEELAMEKLCSQIRVTVDYLGSIPFYNRLL
ncbi:MAG: hypothetical protein SPJ72_04980, partial [Succinivibrio sp.]|nr:hypothetical protein [Succinivibrio sp.]